MKGKAKYAPTIRKALFIFGIVLIVFFGFILICNLVVVVKITVKPNEPPTLFGIMPMVVMSGSMSGEAKDHIETDDLIFISKVDHEKLEVGDIIAYVNDDKTIVTHRIVEIEFDEKDKLRFITKGDANNVNDMPITNDKLLGIYKCRIPKVGRVIMFIQTPIGIVLSVGIPIIIYFAIELVRRNGKKEIKSDVS